MKPDATFYIANAVDEVTLAWRCREQDAPLAEIELSYKAYCHCLKAIVMNTATDAYNIFKSVADTDGLKVMDSLSETLFKSIKDVNNIMYCGYDFNCSNPANADACFELAKKAVTNAIIILGNSIDITQTNYRKAPWRDGAPPMDIELDF